MKMTEMTLRQLRTRKRISVCAAFLLSVLPVSVVIISKWRVWVSNPAQGFAIGAGGVMVGVVVLFSILGRLRIPGDVWVAGFFLVLLLLLRSIMDDLIMVTAMYVGGRVGDKIITAAYVKRVQSEIKAREDAERASKATMDIVKEYLGGDKT